MLPQTIAQWFAQSSTEGRFALHKSIPRYLYASHIPPEPTAGRPHLANRDRCGRSVAAHAANEPKVSLAMKSPGNEFMHIVKKNARDFLNSFQLT